MQVCLPSSSFFVFIPRHTKYFRLLWPLQWERQDLFWSADKGALGSVAIFSSRSIWRVVKNERLPAKALSSPVVETIYLLFFSFLSWNSNILQNFKPKQFVFSNLPFEIIYIFSPTSKFHILFGIVIPLSPPTFDRSRPRENNQWWNKAFAGLKGETLLIDFPVVV